MGWFRKNDEQISTEKMREALRDGYQAKLLALPEDIRNQVLDRIDSLNVNFISVDHVQLTIDEAIEYVQDFSHLKQKIIDRENETYGVIRRTCGTCGVEDGPQTPLQLLLEHLQPIDVKPYCSKCFVAAYNAAQGEYNARLSAHAREEQRRSKPDDEL
jgi:hypothetical protein